MPEGGRGSPTRRDVTDDPGPGRRRSASRAPRKTREVRRARGATDHRVRSRSGPFLAVLFDLDQTLLDRTASLRDFTAWQATRMLRADVADPDRFVSRFAELDANGRVGKDRVYGTLRREFALERWSVEELVASYELGFCAFAKPRAGAVDAVRELAARGLRLGLVSNGRTPFQERNFRALGIADDFGAVVVSEAVGLRKPDRRIFELACRRLGVRPAEAAFVGDDPAADVAGARAAGLQAVHLATATARPVVRADEGAAVAHLGELLHVLGLTGRAPGTGAPERRGVGATPPRRPGPSSTAPSRRSRRGS